MKRVFKLIKKYPGCDLVIGSTITFDDNCAQIINMSGNFILRELENYSEFWQEVIEKNYEIFALSTNSWFGITHSKVDIEAYEEGKASKYTIHAVRRLSDRVVFTIGDETSEGTILCFDTPGSKKDQCRYKIDESGNGWRMLSKANHLGRKLLFTTEDGVDIYSGDYYCRVGRATSSINAFQCWDGDRDNKATPVYSYDTMNKHDYHFSSVEAANEFILMNKPCLSINDVMNAGYGICNSSSLINIVKSKL